MDNRVWYLKSVIQHMLWSSGRLQEWLEDMVFMSGGKLEVLYKTDRFLHHSVRFEMTGTEEQARKFRDILKYNIEKNNE